MLVPHRNVRQLYCLVIHQIIHRPVPVFIPEGELDRFDGAWTFFVPNSALVSRYYVHILQGCFITLFLQEARR